MHNKVFESHRCYIVSSALYMAGFKKVWRHLNSWWIEPSPPPFKEWGRYLDIVFFKGVRSNNDKNKWAIEVKVTSTKFWRFKFTKPQYLKRKIIFISKKYSRHSKRTCNTEHGDKMHERTVGSTYKLILATNNEKV